MYKKSGDFEISLNEDTLACDSESFTCTKLCILGRGLVVAGIPQTNAVGEYRQISL